MNTLQVFFRSPRGVEFLMWFWKLTALMCVFKLFYAPAMNAPLVVAMIGTSALALGYTFHHQRVRAGAEEGSTAGTTMENWMKRLGLATVIVRLGMLFV